MVTRDFRPIPAHFRQCRLNVKENTNISNYLLDCRTDLARMKYVESPSAGQLGHQDPGDDGKGHNRAFISATNYYGGESQVHP